MNKVPFKDIYECYISNGCRLLITESEYRNCETPMPYICECGDTSWSNYSNFKKGNRCKKCGIKKQCQKTRSSQEHIDKNIKSKGWINNSVYINAHTKLELICPYGHVQLKTYNDFHNGYGCFECMLKRFNKKRKLNFRYVLEESLNDYNICISKESDYINNRSKLKFRCPQCNITYEATWMNFNQGARCRECYLKNNVGENHPCYNTDRTREKRMQYLTFDLKKLHILNDDVNYTNLIDYRDLAKRIRKNRHELKNIYEVDHIYPCKAFIDNDLDKIHDPAVIKSICNLRENLRIIPRTENSDKRAKYNQDEFLTWFNLKLKDYTNENSQSTIPQEAEKSTVTG